MKNFKKSEKGQALVEFLLILPVLLALVALIVDVAFLVWVRVSVQNGASEGGRAAQVWRQNVDGVSCVEYVEQAVYRVAYLWEPNVTTNDVCTTDPLDRIAGNEIIEVNVVAEHTPILSYVFFTEDPLWLPIPASVKVRHE